MLRRVVLTGMLVGNAHPTVYQGWRQSPKADWSVPLMLRIMLD